jgi:hypothetical protein
VYVCSLSALVFSIGNDLYRYSFPSQEVVKLRATQTSCAGTVYLNNSIPRSENWSCVIRRVVFSDNVVCFVD